MFRGQLKSQKQAQALYYVNERNTDLPLARFKKKVDQFPSTLARNDSRRFR